MSLKHKVVNRLLGVLPCEECNDDGIVLCFNSDRDHAEIQRCDSCKIFDSDIKAWEYVKPEV